MGTKVPSGHHLLIEVAMNFFITITITVAIAVTIAITVLYCCNTMLIWVWINTY